MVIDVEYDVENGVIDEEERIYLKRYQKEINKLIAYIVRKEIYAKIEGDKVEEILSKKSLLNNMYVSISFADENEIRQINNEYRNVDRVTDVLSFPMFNLDELKEMKKHVNASIKAYESGEEVKNKYKQNSSKYSNVSLGDIIICFDVIKNQAEEYGHSIGRELMYMITHAMFHLLGYDHENEEDKKKMRKREEQVLSNFGYKIEK